MGEFRKTKNRRRQRFLAAMLIFQNTQIQILKLPFGDKLKGFFYFCYVFTSQISTFFKTYVVIMKIETGSHQCLPQLPATLSKVPIKDLTAKSPFPMKLFTMYTLHSMLIFIWFYLFIEFFYWRICRTIFCLLQSSLFLSFLYSSDVRNLKQPLFERALSIPNNI